MSVETFSIREAAEKCGVSYQSIRKRVDRGTLQVVKTAGVRRIPRSELERAGLWPGSTTSDEQLRRENENLRSELEQHRQLTVQAQTLAEAERQAREAAEAAYSKAEAERLAAEQRAASSQEQADEFRPEVDRFRSDLEEVAGAGPLKVWRLRRQIKDRLKGPGEAGS